jgi:CBS domain-containing protein
MALARWATDHHWLLHQERSGDMHHRTVADLMTRDVVRARRDMPFKEIVKLLAENDVTAVPVVDELDRPVGVVSEADLLRKSSAQADPSGLTPIPRLEEWERAKAEGARAEELMSAPAVCARPEWNVIEAARHMAAHSVKRLPVVDEADRLQGIVSRGDLLRIFLRHDDAIRDEITGDVLRGTLGPAASDVTVEVRDGQVTLGGSAEVENLIPVIERLCRSVDGVASVSGHIAHREDDSRASRDGT